MFDTERLPIRFANIQHRTMERGEKEIALVEITLEINPLKPELAQELDGYVRSTLFTRSDAAVTPKLAGARFNLSPLPQEILVRMAPDQTDESFLIREAKIGEFSARRSKKSSAWRLVFTATCNPTSEHHLAQIVDSYLKTRYCTFANAQADLFSEKGQEERKTRRAAAAATGEPAAATH